MNFASFGTVSVLDPSSGGLVAMDLDVLLEELRAAFRACALHEEWMAENLLEVLRERLREDGEDGVCVTSLDIRRMLVGVLYASGFSDVAQEFILRGPKEVPVFQSGDFSGELRTWSVESLEKFLRSHPEIPEEFLPEVLRRLPSMLSGVGFSEASEALVLEISRHLVHFLSGEALSASSVAMTSSIRYITKDDWNLPVDVSGRELLNRRIVVLQPVSDILPVAVVQCHLLRLFDLSEAAPVDEAGLLARMEGVSAFLQQCLVLMRGRMSTQWPDVQFAGAVVRMMGIPGVLKILSSARHRKERRELGIRFEEAIRGNFAQAPFEIVVRFS